MQPQLPPDVPAQRDGRDNRSLLARQTEAAGAAMVMDAGQDEPAPQPGAGARLLNAIVSLAGYGPSSQKNI